MKKFLLLLFTLCVAMGYSQQILLMTENFETPDSAIDFTTGGAGSNMSGSNKWIINNSYSGAPLYPNTTRQDSVVSGNITNAPHSTYLHIYDSVAAVTNSISNCNWNPSAASDRFCFLGNGFCSLGLTDVTFTFFWIAGGDSVSYGQLYYRADGGPWTQTGRAKYQGQSDWLYEVVSDPAFNNKKNLQFGFRWINPTDTITPNMSFGIDDIIAVGTYDNVNHPVHIEITSLYPDTVCQNDYLSIGYKLSQPLCDGQYEIEIINSAGQVVNGPSFPVFSINSPDTSGYTAVQIPTTMSGNCYHIVLVRVSPAPMIVGDTSICFSAVRCPASIYTFGAPVMTDPDTPCVQSEIDVKFYSFGTFGPNNTYTAQLSDSNGNFTSPYRLGTLVSNLNYAGPPGNVSGLIPANVPPGCGYYIRVISNSPATIGTLIGPFCIKHCDVETNNITDLDYCIGFPYATDTNRFVIQIHHWDSISHYDTCNNFIVQLLSMQDFSIVNTGGIGVYHINRSDTFQLIVGPPASLPVAPGSYYLRILSTCSSNPNNETGTVIRITIGSPAVIPPKIEAPDSVFCNDGLVTLTIDSFYNFESQYEWLSPGLNNGLPFIWPTNQLIINFTNAAIGTYTFQVREINYNCPGPWSAVKKIHIIGIPKVHISGPAITCLGDTATFYVDYLPRTYYNWTVPPGVHIVLQGNSEVSMIFDSVGTYTISEFSLNACGSDSGTYTFTVASLLNVQIAPKQNLCFGDSLRLSATTFGASHALLTIDSGTTGKPGAMFNLIAHDDLTIDSFACKVLLGAGQQVDVSIYQKVGTYQGNELNNAVWPFILTSSAITTGTNQMTTLPDYVGLSMSAGDTFGIYLTTIDSPNINIAYSPPGPPGNEGVVYKSDGILDYVQGVVNNLAPHYQPFGAYLATRVWNGIVYYHTKAGLHYIWNTGDTTPSINAFPHADSLYTVKLFDNSGCNTSDSVLMHINPVPTISVGPDTVICDGLTYSIPGVSTGQSIVWTPSAGLDNPNIAAPKFFYNDSVSYVIIAFDTTGCADTTHLNIGAINCASYIDVPQAFSPNSNGVNDHFTLFANKIAEYEIKIYNRWGELVYESTDLSELNDMSKGWDGTYKGKPQSVGTFVYYLTATDDYNKKISKKGNITLLR